MKLIVTRETTAVCLTVMCSLVALLMAMLISVSLRLASLSKSADLKLLLSIAVSSSVRFVS